MGLLGALNCGEYSYARLDVHYGTDGVAIA